jgi:peptidoglycan/LPS O-acetylase OafA/YrhL
VDAPARAAGSRGPASIPKKSSFRPDIEGLRAFAVVLVVLNHLKLWPDGGFVGVDVFFTISGFLITGLIADEISRTGRFSIKNFYIRRARRILPAAMATLLVTWLVAGIVFVSTRVHDTGVDIWWSVGFLANIHFANQGTSYFQTYQQPSLVQHYWSLAVEEQFYVVWPLLLLVVTLWARRAAGPRAGTRVLQVAGAVTVLSFAWCVYQTATSPDAAYFSTVGRAWELGAGALVALAARQGFTVGERWAGPLSLIGVVGIVASAAMLTGTSTFPGPGAALPVLASSLVLFAGCGGVNVSTPWHVPLINKLSRFIGRVSFSLYLWHWPTILVVEALVAPTAGIYYPLVITAITTLTVFGYYAIEMPFHKAGSAKKAVAPIDRPGGVPFFARQGFRKPAAAVAALVACTLVLWSLRPATPAAVTVNAADDVAAGPQTDQLKQDMALALQATAWPTDLSPPLTDVINLKTPPDVIADCTGSTTATVPPAAGCTYGSLTAPKVAFVVGDSTAGAYMELFRSIVATHATNWQVRYIGMAGCTFNNVRIDNPVKAVADACPARKQAAVDLIKQAHPDLVVVTSNFSTQISAATGTALSIADWAVGLQQYVDQFRSAAKDVLFLAPPPVDADIVQCYTALSVPATCMSRVTENWSGYAAAVTAIATTEQAHYVDSAQWFCVSKLCPAFVGTVVTKRDVVHLTDAYADRIAPAVFEAFGAQGLFG